jgi:transcriptional regulator with XRE-family HTH domain
MVGLSASFTSQMERGLTTAPGEDAIKKMAEILNKNPDELLALSGKVSSDVLDIILQAPVELSALIRRHNHSSGRRKKQAFSVDDIETLEFFPLERISALLQKI